MGLRDSLTPEQLEVLGEVLNDALEEARETLRLHEDDTLGWYQHVTESLGDTAEVYLELISMQKRRIEVINQLMVMIGRASG